MPNPTDPFDCVRDICTFCEDAPAVKLFGERWGHEHIECKHIRLASKTAMRRAVVDWLDEQSRFERDKGDKFSGSESLDLMARKLERGGHETRN